MAKQALDTFVTTLPDGSERAVMKGQVLVDGHEIVKHVPGLFIDFETGEEAPAKRGPGRPKKDS
jgi:hypothetical protein